ncbi:MAG: ROK family protein [Lachnospiraceae bacterium]
MMINEKKEKIRIAVVDIGGTNIKAGVWDNDALCDILEYNTDAKKGGVYIIKSVIDILKQYLPFDRIGISTAGQVDCIKGSIIYANSNIPNYTGINIKHILEETFQVPVVVENDVNAAAIGEGIFGAGKCAKQYICLTYGTGVGGAIVLNQEIYHGSTFSAGEVGAMIVHPEDRDIKKDLYSGCYERYASTTALVEKAKVVNTLITNGRDIFYAIESDKIKQIVDQWINEVSYGLISLIHILNPTDVILGGGIMEQNYIVERVNSIVRKNLIESYRDVKIVQAELGNKAGLYGMIYLANNINKKE